MSLTLPGYLYSLRTFIKPEELRLREEAKNCKVEQNIYLAFIDIEF